MTRTSEAIERGLALYADLVGEDAALEAEFEHSAVRFTGGSDDPAAARRHLEWFVLERPSPHLDGIPADVLRAAWNARAGDPELDLGDAFLHSRAGAFEVTSSTDTGLWVRDLAALGEYPVDEPEVASELRPGDLLVGRLFPVGEGLFALSPAMAVFRDERLLHAVRADLERMRQARRGVLRIQQIELERLFFPTDAGPGALEARLDAARDELVAIGLAPDQATAMVRRVADAEHERTVTEILNELAFETDVDLGRAQRALVELWTARRQAGPGTGRGRRRTAAAVAPPRSKGTAKRGSTGGIRGALEAFDRGRAKGRDLEQLFEELAENVGIDLSDDEGDDDAQTTTPDFPGVVGAMVEEFLWDVGRERGTPTAQRLAGLRRLSRWGADIGVFENLGRRDLLTFAGRWLLDEGDLAGPEEARAVLDALAEFCRWCEERHAHPLWEEFASSWKPLAESVPRLVRARRELGPPPADPRPHDVVALDDPGDSRRSGEAVLVLNDESGASVRGRVPSALRGLLRPGDSVHAVLGSDGAWCIAACYPGELRQLLRER